MMLSARYTFKETFPIALTKSFGNTRREHTLVSARTKKGPVVRDHALNFRRDAPAQKSGTTRATPPLARGARGRHFIRRAIGWPLDAHHRQYHDGRGSPQPIK
jgi:hypothetical protein